MGLISASQMCYGNFKKLDDDFYSLQIAFYSTRSELKLIHFKINSGSG